MKFPDSSVIRDADYNRDAGTLEITFKTGRNYTYFGVPEWTYDALVSAPSPGEYFNTHIRGEYEFREHTSPPPSRRKRGTGARRPRRTLH
jgi:lysyl-tRNA synthetase class 2